MKELLLSSSQSGWLLIVFAIVLFLVMLIFLGLRHGKRTFLQRKIALSGIDVIQNAQLVDAVGDDLMIDFLVLQPEKIIAMTVLPYEGIIFAAEQIEQWTQVVKSGSFKFTNPYQNFATQKNTVERAIPAANIECRVFFPNASFPKDKPEAVLLMDDLPKKRQYKAVHIKDVSAAVAESWNLLKGKI